MHLIMIGPRSGHKWAELTGSRIAPSAVSRADSMQQAPSGTPGGYKISGNLFSGGIGRKSAIPELLNILSATISHHSFS